ncbi:unnamed protein product [Penicillium olsonii]|nr:unnamed protein product [Penicillium olsonii]CAG7923458.1 unnamed protein product [Penicillium olsonii]
MMSGLKHNICGLASYGTELRDIDPQTIDQHLNAELQYACRYWVHHLQRSKDQVSESDILSFLEEHFLHWLEALALMRRLSEAIGMIEILKSATTIYDGSKLPRFLEDAERFNFYTTHVARTAPLQLYSYGLVFAPSESIVKQKFLKKEIAPHIKSFPVVDKTWGANRQTLDGHEDIIDSFAVSPSGKTLASLSDDKTIKIWDMTTGTRKQTLLHPDPNDRFNHMTFCDGGNTLITGTKTTLIHWDLTIGVPRKELTCHSSFEPYTAACNGHTLAISSEEGEIEIIDADTGIPCSTFSGHSDVISALAFSPDGLTLASGSRDTTIKIWDAVKCILLKTLTGHSSYIRSLIFSPNGLCLASTGGSTAASESIKLWDTYHGTLQSTLQFDTDEVESMAFSPDGRTLAFGSSDRTIKFWDTPESTKAHLLRCHCMVEKASAVLFSPDGQTLVSGDFDGIIMLWNTYGDRDQSKTGERVYPISSVNLSPGGNILLSGSFDRTLGLWDTKEGHLRKTIKHSDYYSTAILAVAMSPDGLRIASFDEDGVIWIWDTSTGKLQHKICWTRGCHYDVSLVFSPDGRLLASSSRRDSEHPMGVKGNQTIKLWDTASYQNVQTFEGSCRAASMVKAVTFSPDGQTLALSFEEGIKSIIEIRETSTGMLRQTFLYPVPRYGRISSLEFSSNGTGLEISFTDEFTSLCQPLGDDFGSSNLNLMKTSESSIRLSLSGRWITLGGENILWVPAGYGVTDYDFVIKRSTIAFGLGDGRTSIIGFNVDGAESQETVST